MIYRIIFLCVIGTIVSNCSAGFNNLFTVGGISTAVVNKNAYSIGYNAILEDSRPLVATYSGNNSNDTYAPVI